MYLYVFVCICMYLYVLCMCIHLNVFARICMYLYVYTFVYMVRYMIVCICICMYLCVGLNPKPYTHRPKFQSDVCMISNYYQDFFPPIITKTFFPLMSLYLHGPSGCSGLPGICGWVAEQVHGRGRATTFRDVWGRDGCDGCH